MKPFIKWAGGKRWLVDRKEFEIPTFSGTYIEPFLGGGALFFHLSPRRAIVADTNARLIETYKAIAKDPESVRQKLYLHHRAHCKSYYYSERSRLRRSSAARAAQFLYLNRTCWNGLYRENLKGEFNVPIGTKSNVYDALEDFNAAAASLRRAKISCQDFEATIAEANRGDFVFVDPPYTTAHNVNGFVKYNQKIFTWDDQIRLRDAVFRASARGARVLVTNANHESIADLYKKAMYACVLNRNSIISGSSSSRRSTTELLITL